jgi:hypothetical protein
MVESLSNGNFQHYSLNRSFSAMLRPDLKHGIVEKFLETKKKVPPVRVAQKISHSLQ